jgi:hypothetical protein
MLTDGGAGLVSIKAMHICTYERLVALSRTENGGRTGAGMK